MAGIPIPHLRLKLRFLIDHGIFKNWEELAQTFGVKRKTPQWWGHGDDARNTDTLPSRHYNRFLEIISAQLGHALTTTEIKHLIGASYDEWEDAFKSENCTLISLLIEREAIIPPIQLFLKPTPETGLIETDLSEPNPEPRFIVKKDTWFRLECIAQSNAEHLFAVQHAGKNWGAVPLSFDKKTHKVYLPTRPKRSKYNHMIEKRDVGIEHSFIIFQTPKPIPLDIQHYLKENLEFDGKGLSKLATFYESQKEDKRHLYLITLKIEE